MKCLMFRYSGEIVEITTDKIQIKNGNLHILENYDIVDEDDEHYSLFIYGNTKVGDSNIPFNKYQFQKCNPIGVVYSFMLNSKGDFEDLTIETFKDIYEEEESLDRMIIEDEIGDISEDSYEEDDFVVKD